MAHLFRRYPISNRPPRHFRNSFFAKSPENPNFPKSFPTHRSHLHSGRFAPISSLDDVTWCLKSPAANQGAPSTCQLTPIPEAQSVSVSGEVRISESALPKNRPDRTRIGVVSGWSRGGGGFPGRADPETGKKGGKIGFSGKPGRHLGCRRAGGSRPR